jgi:hypothetical protein
MKGDKSAPANQQDLAIVADNTVDDQSDPGM